MGAFSIICPDHLRNHTAAYDQGPGYSEKFKYNFYRHETSLNINREMQLSPRVHYIFLSSSRIQDERLPIDLLNYFVADFMILPVEDAGWTQRIIFALDADLLRINEHGNIIHDYINCFRHRFFQCPRYSS
jgi:hypothetical protein